MAINDTVKKVNSLLSSRARENNAAPPTPQPIIGKGKAKQRSEAEVAIVWYKWCQDIIQDALTFQMETRPEQLAAVASPNAKPQEKKESV